MKKINILNADYNMVVNINMIFSHPDTGSAHHECYIELNDDCYLENGNIDTDIFRDLWKKYDYGYYYHELTVYVKIYLSDSVFIHEYYLTRYTCELISKTKKRIV
jgi:hypothetical protein